MRNKELFHKTVGILVKAYQQDALTHGDCTRCAVGNLICANVFLGNHKKWEKHYLDNVFESWSEVFMTHPIDGQRIIQLNYRNEAKHQIDSTGYSVKELASIEKSFELSDQGENADDYMFNGLMSVIDTLMEIHQCSEVEAKEAKAMFVKV